MKELELLVEKEKALTRYGLLYQLIGLFGDDLPPQIQDAMKLKAKKELENVDHILKKLKETIK